MARLPGGIGFRSGPDRTVNQQETEFLRRKVTELGQDVETISAALDGLEETDHGRKHVITSTLDHSSTATPGKILKADVNGLPVDGTNTDAQVAAAVVSAHNAMSVAGAPLTLADQQITFNKDASDFQLDGNNLQIKDSGVSHNSTGGLQGGTPGEYNHLTNAQVALVHARQHAITSSNDHTSAATPGRVLKADANGLPIETDVVASDLSAVVNLVTYTTTTEAVEGFYRIATIPIATAIKQCQFIVKAYTATGTVTESTMFVNLAYYSGSYSNQNTAIAANTSHSYDSQTNAENGWVLRYCRVSFDATTGYIDLYKYKGTVVTIETTPITQNDWTWATGALTANPAVGGYKNISVTTQSGMCSSAGYVASSGASGVTNYGVWLGTSVSNTTDKTNQWSYVGNVTITFNSTYRYGSSINLKLIFKEIAEAGRVSASSLEDFAVYLKCGLGTVADATAFNAAVPDISVEVDGKTTLVPGTDIVAFTSATSTSSKTIRLYIKNKGTNTHYQIEPQNRYGQSYNSTYVKNYSYCVFSVATDQGTVGSLPATAQGSYIYAIERVIDHNDLANIGTYTHAELDTYYNDHNHDGSASGGSPVEHGNLQSVDGAGPEYNHLNNAQVAALHARSHAITSASDHTSAATPGQILKADASGLPINATNTDAQVAAAVTASHARQHAITSTADHTSAATPGRVLKADANGLPVETANTYSELATAVSLAHPAGAFYNAEAIDPLYLDYNEITGYDDLMLRYDGTDFQLNDNMALQIKDSGIDHGSVTGLTHDDHTQYLLADGSRTVTGHLSLESANQYEPYIHFQGTHPVTDIGGAISLFDEQLVIKTGNAGAETERIYVNRDGKVGVNRVADTQQFEVGGTAGKTAGGTTWVDRCDADLKDDITDLKEHGSSLEKLLKLRPRKFRWKDPELHKQEGYRAGLVAQEVKPILPEWVIDKAMDGYMGFNPVGWEAMFVQALQEQQEIIKGQATKIDDLTARIEVLEKATKLSK